MAPRAQGWDGRSHGGVALQRLIAVILPLLGYRRARLLSLLVAALVLPLAGRYRSACVDYWRRLRPGLDRASALGLAWRQLASFGAILVDRVLAYASPRPLRLGEQGFRALMQAAGQGRGLVLVSAHVGNWELAGRLFGRLGGRPITVVQVDNRSTGERALLDRFMGDAAPRLIDPRDPIAAGLALRQVLDRGDPVCLLGDRVHAGQASIAVRFLGAPVHFPIGPCLLAAQAGVPLVPWFLLRLRPGAYRFVALPPRLVRLPRRRTGRSAALHRAVQDWATELERQVRRHPFQWHNFYHFWRSPQHPAVSSTAPPEA